MKTAFYSLIRWPHWRGLVARLPLPLLALAASFGVYRFAAMFVPTWVAVVQAAAFELVYIGLAVAQIAPDQRRRAGAISIGAVVVSMCYNSLDGLFHLRPQLLEAPPLWAHIALALLHGVPLALLAYLVADLLLHQQAPEAPKLSVESFGASSRGSNGNGGRPAQHTLDGLLAVVEPEFTREDAMRRLGCSASTADRLLGEAVQLGAVERLERGSYRLAGVVVVEGGA